MTQTHRSLFPVYIQSRVGVRLMGGSPSHRDLGLRLRLPCGSTMLRASSQQKGKVRVGEACLLLGALLQRDPYHFLSQKPF